MNMNMKMNNHIGTDERRKHIIREAATLFEKRGYFNTSMSDIAKAVGMGKSSLYYYFSSKEKILYHIHEEFIDHLISLHRLRLNKGMTCALLLQNVLIDILKQIAEFPGYVRAFFDHYRQLNGDMKKQIEGKRDVYYRMIEDVFRQGEARGEFQTINPPLATLAFFGMCNWAYQWYNPEGQWQPREIALHFWDIFMQGICKQGR